MDILEYLSLFVICLNGYYESASSQTDFCQMPQLNRYGFRIQSGIFHTKLNFGLIPCAKECKMRTNCRSFNFHRANLTCELSSETSTSLPSQVVNSFGYLQSDISTWPQILAVECADVTCPANHKCTALSSGNTVCLISECAAPPSVSNAGHASTEVGVTAKVSYTCEAGYTMSGNPDITCKADGTWTTPGFSCTASCAGSVFASNGKCYVMSTTTVPYSDALAACQADNNHLVDITTSAENDFVKAMVQSTGVNTWIGGTDVAREGTWVWDHTGSSFTFTDWYPSDPDGGTGQNCVGIWTSLNYQWIDVGCTSSLNYICKSNQ